MLTATIQIHNNPDSGEWVKLGLNADEFQFIYAADVQEPPYYVPMADHPSVETLAQRFAEKVSGRGKSIGVSASASGDSITLTTIYEETTAEQLTLETNSPDVVLTPFS
jgi:hypothetical protein